MEFKQLEAFAAVVRMKSFSRAAEQLYLTQPTISAHIASLEKELGCPLIVRNPKEALPTEAGQRLLTYALDMLSLRDSALAACRAGAGELGGTVTIAASTVTYQYVLPRAMSLFRQSHPKVRFNVTGGDSAQVASHIKDGRAELGLTGAVIDNGACVYSEFMDDYLVVITPPGPEYSAAAQDGFGPQQLKTLPFIVREPGSGTRRETELWLQEHGVAMGELNVVAQMEEPDAIKNAVGQGLGISIISRLAAEDYEKLGLVRIFPLAGGPIPRKLYTVKHRFRHISPAAAAFVEFVEQKGLAGGAGRESL